MRGSATSRSGEFAGAGRQQCDPKHAAPEAFREFLRRMALLPGLDLARKAPVTRNALFGRGAIQAVEHAQRVLSREQFVFGQAAMVECVAHCSRHAFSLNMARRIQLFMVPSGTFMRVARSS